MSSPTVLDRRGVISQPLPLWPHQAEAVDHVLARSGSLLDIGMGGLGGKSRIAVEVAERIDAARILIVCPKSVTGVWPRELAQHGERDWMTWAGEVLGRSGKPLASASVSKRAEALIQATKDAIVLGRPLAAVVNFEASWQGQMGALLLGTRWDLLVIDESHRIKSAGGKASTFLARLAHRVRANGGRVIAQTGTPMPHSPLDVWAQVRAVDGGERFGTSFHRFCQGYGAGESIYTAGGVQRTVYRDVRPDRLGRFTDLLDEVTFRVPQADLDAKLGLPETVDVTRTVELDAATRRAYEQLERDLVTEIGDGTVTAANAMVLTTRLAQLSGGFARDIDGEWRYVADPPEKARLLADVLEDLDEPVVVFGRFHADLDAIAKVAQGLGRSYGELSGRRRDGLTADSRMAEVDILACQLKSGGVGIDLTRARVCVFYSLDFALADYLQARKRIHRPGQTRTSLYVHLLASNTIDRAVIGALRRREDAIAAVLAHLTTTEGRGS